MSTGAELTARADAGLPARLARSAAATESGAWMRTADFTSWLDDRRRAHRFEVTRIPFADLDGWGFQPGTGNLVHRTGRFFTIEGLHIVNRGGPFPDWQQPIIDQPEVGILGIVAREFDGVLHFLMQAKMEPGNPNLLQLSPTVQATRSNYTGAHRGAKVKYIDYFTEPGRCRTLVDTLQSEHGTWFYHKSNRNTIVETREDVPVDEDFCWLTLGQIGELLRRDNVVNMDARTVLSCAPMPYAEPNALHSDVELLSWFSTERSRHEVRIRRLPLAEVSDWERGDTGIEHVPPRYFRVMAVAASGNREVSAWTQPLIEPLKIGLTAFVIRRFGGVPHILMHARVEPGFLDTIELGPTVQCTPDYYTHGYRPAFLDLVLNAPRDRIRYEAVHSEEGGRFFHAQNRSLIVEADESEAPTTPPDGYRWCSLGQISHLLRHGRYVNVQARTLLAVLNTGVVPV
ncbi:NDP-hexose 2,3-dehydratase family protein [Saccharothrix obliqua]|uniref:NDP-hexose 2,3-dehydratase family protein n=1 Tax=Saccharothrix obliqua TaxID=2861747 RepID=UPI002150EC52|nr:NDP-hexose 2,3-dehydratase family protein [Saccharothrix obliqua]